MAEESGDMSNFDGHDDEVVEGGGYMDDDIDVDDDDDDEPLVSLAPKPRSSTLTKPKQPLQKKRPKPQANLAQPSPKKKRVSDPDPRDYELRSMSTGDTRDFLVARFLENPPQFHEDTHVRIYRENEDTEEGRKNGLEAHHKQKAYYNTFAGKRRLERYKNQSIVHIMDRHKKGWKMDVTTKDIAQQIEEHRKKKIETRKKNALRNGTANSMGGNQNNQEEEPEDLTQNELDSFVNSYSGAFDGKSTAPYCMMILNEGTRKVDVVPIDNYAWYAFRANRQKPKDPEATEAAEARYLKLMKKKEQRLNQFQAKYEEAQMEREQAMGDNSRVENSKEYASVGIRRSKVAQARAKRESDDLITEGMEFEMEFDNDDVALVDKETIAKNENRILGDAEQQAREFRKLIKDEPETTKPLSSGSDSEEDPASRDSPSRSRSASPSPGHSASQSPRRSVSPSPGQGKPKAARPPIRPNKPTATGPNRRSPSPGGGRERSPTPVDVSHLLPPRGTLPNEDHVRAVLSHMLREKTRVSFKLFLKNFERNTQVQKDNLTRILRQIAQVEADPVRSKNYFISWKRPTAAAAPNS